MAAEKCDISFKIDYISSLPVTSAIAYYKIKGSTHSYTVHIINPVPISGGTVALPPIEGVDTYDLLVTLNTKEGLIANKESSFKIGDCNGSRTRTIFWNHATFIEDKWGTVVSFVIKKNDVIIVDTTKTNTRYIDPIETWQAFTAQIGDKIEFSTKLKLSGTKFRGSGGMFTYSTTGSAGTVNIMNPTAPNTESMDFQHIGPSSGTERVFVFTVNPELNYALGTSFTTMFD